MTQDIYFDFKNTCIFWEDWSIRVHPENNAFQPQFGGICLKISDTIWSGNRHTVLWLTKRDLMPFSIISSGMEDWSAFESGGVRENKFQLNKMIANEAMVPRVT